MVGRCDVHDPNFGMADDLMPVGRALLEAEAFLGLSGAGLHFVRADDQTSPDAARVEAVSRPSGTNGCGQVPSTPCRSRRRQCHVLEPFY